jgi:hypothetical protein
MTTIIFTDGYELEIDATTKENHGRRATVTKHKVEDGSQVTDHFVKENQTFSIDGVISEFSIEEVDGFTKMTSQLKDRLESAYLNTELLTVKTDYKTYENVVLIGYSIPREITHGGSLFFTLDFEEIRFAETKTVKVEKVPKGAIQKTNPSLTEEKRKKENKKTRRRTSSKGHKNKITMNEKTIDSKIKLK